jgi:hypothetical protein
MRQVARETRLAGDVVGEGYSLLGQGAIHVRQGDLVKADRDLRAAKTLADQSGDALLTGQVLLSGAELDLLRGPVSAARAGLASANTVFASFGAPEYWNTRCLELESLIQQRERNG